MDDKRPIINITLPDPLKHFAKDHPGWKLAALVAILVGVYFLKH